MTRLLLIAVFALLAGPAAAMEYSKETLRAKSGREVNVIRASGDVTFYIRQNDVMRWRSILLDLDRDKPTLVVLWSAGGQYHAGSMLIKEAVEFVREQTARHVQVAVLVDKGCLSVCIPLFHSFPRRFASETAQFGFHGVSAGSFGNDAEETRGFLESMTRRAADRGERETLDWLAARKAEGVFASSDLFFRTGRELADERSGIVLPADLVADEAAAVDILGLSD